MNSCGWFWGCCREKPNYITQLREQKPLVTFHEEHKDPRIGELGLKLNIKESGSLALDPNVTHPFVKVHVIDLETCMPLAKSGVRNCTSFNESSQIYN
jgi:hypothetical protein